MIALIVFARLPIAGQVKTRIANASSDDFALALYVALLEQTLGAATLAAAQSTLPIKVIWHFEGQIEAVTQPMPLHISRFLATPEHLVRQLPSSDLGARMCAALNEAGVPGILIGSDVPDLDATRLNEAINGLLPTAMLFNPTKDGGYCLVGKGFAEAAPAGVFENIRWSSPQVMEQTRGQLKALNVDWVELEPLSDVDDLAAGLHFLNGLRKGL
jgi:uncharacterized protein